MLEDIKNTTDEAKSYTTWFESEWKRNGVDELVKHNKQLEANVYKLLSIIEQAEKTIEQLGNMDDPDKIGELARQALKTIRGE